VGRDYLVMGRSRIQESELVEAAKEGDSAAFSLLVSEHQAPVIRLCSRLLRDDHLAEDAFQEACVTAWVDVRRLRKPDRFGAWLAAIAINICKGWLRKLRPNEWSLDVLKGGVFFDLSESVPLRRGRRKRRGAGPPILADIFSAP
jgi:RNA polymerase sigma factor (sigma-70 family)